MNEEHNNANDQKQPVLLQLLPSLQSGGVERGTIDVTKAAVKAGFKVVVASAGGYMSHQVVSAGGVHVSMPLTKRNPIAIFRNAKRIKKLIQEYQVDIVHARSRGPAWSGYFAAKKMGVPFITTMHGNHSTSFPFKKSYNKIMTKGQRVIAISEFIREHMVETYHTDPAKITVIPRGVDIEQFDAKKVTERRIVQMIDRLRLPEDKSIVLLPGRITRWKGQDVLLQALKHLNKKDIFCVMLGDDEKHPGYREELRRIILKEGLAPYVAIIGNVNDMPAAYRLANVVLSTSVRPEAFGRVPAEAGAMERVVIAPNHGGAQEIIEDGKTGWLVEPSNPKALAEAIERALALSDDERDEMGKKAKARVRKKFTVQKMCESTIELYHQILAGKEIEAQPEEIVEAAVEVEEEMQEGAQLPQEPQEEKQAVAKSQKSKRGCKKKDEQPGLFADEEKTKAPKKASKAKSEKAPKKSVTKKVKASSDAKPKKRGRPKKVKESA